MQGLLGCRLVAKVMFKFLCGRGDVLSCEPQTQPSHYIIVRKLTWPHCNIYVQIAYIYCIFLNYYFSMGFGWGKETRNLIYISI